MSRPGHDAISILDARTASLRRAVLQAERALAREIKRRAILCQCQGGCLGGGYIYTQADFEEMRGIFEAARTAWLAEHKLKAVHKMKTPPALIAEAADV